MKNSTSNKIRWVLIAPLTVLATLLVLVILLRLAGITMGVSSDQTQINFWFVIGGSLPAVVWVYTSYLIAPEYKVKTLWWSFIIGSLLSTFITYPSFKHLANFSLFTPWSLAHLFAILCGLLTVLWLQYKAQHDEIP